MQGPQGQELGLAEPRVFVLTFFGSWTHLAIRGNPLPGTVCEHSSGSVYNFRDLRTHEAIVCALEQPSGPEMAP